MTAYVQWQRLGRIFKPDGGLSWQTSHAQIPTLGPLTTQGLLPIYFATRDAQGRSQTARLDLNPDDRFAVAQLYPQPVLLPGALGCFDDCGAMPSCVVAQGNVQYLYYIGWNQCTSVPYRNAIGLAVSEDGGQTFQRMFDGPIMDRTAREPHFCAAPTVIVEQGLWRMWYLSCTRWEMHNGLAEPFYHIKYAESDDGIHWRREGRVCIDYLNETEGGLVRPAIYRSQHGYHMWFSYRSGSGFREQSDRAYRIGYAFSTDGLHWQRDDAFAGLQTSTDPQAWDHFMLCYPSVFEHRGHLYLFYNGNGFGREGFGLAQGSWML